MQSRKRFPEYRRKGGAPTRVSGMHCRRSKRWTWGSGRGARMLNTRAFAGAVAFAVASVASTVLGVTMDMIAIGNAGNIGNPGSSPSGLGAVPYLYLMSSKETTNTDYVAFLNAVDPNGTQTVGIFQPQMQSDARGGIAFDAAGTVGAKYSVKPGSLQPNGSYATMPANYINWFSAARFVNWLHNGQQNSAASMENGSYTLNGITSGSVVPRNPGATFVLPTVDEWYKAAFFDGSAYTQYQTNSNVAPTASLNIALANVGNFANISSGPMDVGAYAASTSSYGLYEMLGNITEITETAGTSAGQFRPMGGGFAGSVSAWNALSAAQSISTTVTNPNYGFRVAAVPEPSTFVLGGVAISALAGYEWSRRRKVKAALAA
jgi:formylglycine-generating enzyme required for sulfatase activity